MSTHILSSNVEVSEETNIPLTPDMETWIHSMRFSNIPHSVYDGNFPEKPKGVIPPVYMLVFMPEGSERHIDKLIIEFDEDGSWTHTWVDSSDSSFWVPNKNSGFSIEETAFIVALQLEETNRSKSWPYHRAQKNQWSFTQAGEDIQRRIKKIERAKTMRAIELSALKMLATEHKEKYEELVDAASVEKALTSDWFVE
jgi:hypothetical protein